VACAGRNQKFMNLPPGYVVSDRDGSMQYEWFEGASRRAVVDDMAAKHHRIGNCDEHILESLDAADQDRFFDNISRGIGDLHSVTNFEGSHICEDDPCDYVGDD
jgi:hypothetical protein